MPTPILIIIFWFGFCVFTICHVTYLDLQEGSGNFIVFLETQTVKFGKKITCLVTLVAWCCMSGLWKNLVAWHPAFCPCFTAAQCKQTCPYGLLFQSSFIISLLHDQANILCFFQISQTLLEIKQTIFKHISLGEPCLLCRESFKTF